VSDLPVATGPREGHRSIFGFWCPFFLPCAEKMGSAVSGKKIAGPRLLEQGNRSGGGGKGKKPAGAPGDGQGGVAPWLVNGFGSFLFWGEAKEDQALPREVQIIYRRRFFFFLALVDEHR